MLPGVARRHLLLAAGRNFCVLVLVSDSSKIDMFVGNNISINNLFFALMVLEVTD